MNAAGTRLLKYATENCLAIYTPKKPTHVPFHAKVDTTTRGIMVTKNSLVTNTEALVATSLEHSGVIFEVRASGE